VLNKIQTEAIQGGMELAVLQVEFQGQVTGKKFAILDWGTFHNMIDYPKTSMLFIESKGGEPRTILLKMDEITRIRACVTQNLIWAMKICLSNTRWFALTSWENFLELWEASK
jgi:hypothetical protein